MLHEGTLVDRYTVESVIGTGGTAVVYRVKHSSLGTVHALKVLSVTSDAIRQRMLQEGRVQASLDHQNIVSVTDVLEVDGQPGLLMEFIEGPSLEQAMTRYQLDLETAETLFLGIVAGVRRAHSVGLVHRDLKPANVLLANTAKGFVPKVTDFGLAKVLSDGRAPGSSQTRQGVAMGTPAYMAPEQIRDAGGVDFRADIWSLGCILYELMVGQRTFPGDDTLAIYNAIVAGDIIPPQEFRPGMEPRIAAAIRGALTVARDERIPNCDRLLSVLRGDSEWHGPPLRGTQKAETTVEVVGEAAGPMLTLAENAVPLTSDIPTMWDTTTASSALVTQEGEAADPLFGPLPGESLTGEAGPVATPLDAVESLATPPADPPRRATWPLFAGLAALAGAVLCLGLGWSMRTPPAPAPVVSPAPRIVAEIPPERAEPETPSPEPAKPVTPEQPASTPAPSPSVAEPGEPEPEAVQPQVVTVAPTPAVPAPPTAAEVTPVRPSSFVYKILSVPTTAFVSVDGKPVGRTPFKGSVGPGEHSVSLSVDGEKRQFTIDVAEGAPNKWCYVFKSGRLRDGACP